MSYFSKVTIVPTEAARVFTEQKNRTYRLHQLLWKLFPNTSQAKPEQPHSKRVFLFREYQNQNREHCFYVLSSTKPTGEHAALRTISKPFSPKLQNGQKLAFELRANPVISHEVIEQGKRKVRRHDVLMHAKHQTKKTEIQGQSPQSLMNQAAISWLLNERRMQSWGIHVDHSPTVSAYQQHRMQRAKSSSTIQISSVDYQGILTVNDAEIFTEQLLKGFGKAKAFGCGLMLIKPI